MRGTAWDMYVSEGGPLKVGAPQHPVEMSQGPFTCK